MIWAIASAPFWILAAVAAVVAAASTWTGLHGSMYRRGVDQEKLNKPQHSYFLIGVGCWIISGTLALHAYPVETHSRKNLLDVEVMYETRLG